MFKQPLRQMALAVCASLAPFPITRDEVEPSEQLHQNAAQKVFAIPELFENILLHLDQGALITKALRTCRHWNDFITHSSALQQHLFFEPRDNQSPRILNPILTGLFPDWFPSDKEQDHPIGASFNERQLGKWLPRLWHGRMEAMSYEHASWRIMLPCQPPLYRMIRCTLHRGRVRHDKLVTLTQPDPDQIVVAEPKSRREDCNNEYEFAHEEVLPDYPIWMYKLYSLVVTDGNYGGRTDAWHFVWDRNTDTDLSSCVSGDIVGGLEGVLTEALKRDGLVFFEWVTNDCGHGPRVQYFLNTGLIWSEQDEEDVDFLDPHYCSEGEPYGHRLRAWHMGYWKHDEMGMFSTPRGTRLQPESM